MIDEIKKEIKIGKLVIGTRSSLKELKNGKLRKVFLSSNCPDNIKTEVHKLGQVFSTEIEVLTVPNDELGTICKKQFSISIIGEKK